MLVTIEQLRAKPGREAELAERMASLADAIREEPGCLEVRRARSSHEARLFLLLSRYASDAALDDHVRSPHYTEALPALMDCLEQPPEVVLFEEIEEAKDVA